MALAFIAGCAGATPATKAREALAVLAVAGARADDVLAHEYAKRAGVELDRADTFSDYSDRMSRLDKAVDAIGVLRLALLAAESALDGWERGDKDGDFLAAMGCVAEATTRVIHAFDAAGLALPASMAKATAALSSMPRCGVSDGR